MEKPTLCQQFLKVIDEEVPASRKCLERIPESLYGYKPHEKSMALGYLALLVADIPNWITHMLEQGDVDFATYGRFEPKSTAELVAHFDKNLENVKKALSQASDEKLQETFNLKANGQVLMTMAMGDSISSSIRHWVHHRGQLTVYMRLNNIPVPSIYGPTADEKAW